MIKKEKYFYPAIFSQNEGEEIAVIFPDLNCATSGENEKDALLSARDLLACVLFGLEEDGEEIPKPSPINSIKINENQKAVLIDVFIPSIKMAKAN